jgi:NAD(P)-dependent dehydrogenase (short-subunit alcohol dehydrogenase family)
MVRPHRRRPAVYSASKAAVHSITQSAAAELGEKGIRVNGAAVFLASDGSSFVNGHNLVVDGALSAVGRGWSQSIAGRAEIAKRVKAAAAAL